MFERKRIAGREDNPLVQGKFGHLGAMREAMAGRRALAQMDDRMFADIGTSHSEAAVEMNRKPWDTAPNGRGR